MLSRNIPASKIKLNDLLITKKKKVKPVQILELMNINNWESCKKKKKKKKLNSAHFIYLL